MTCILHKIWKNFNRYLQKKIQEQNRTVSEKQKGKGNPMKRLSYTYQNKQMYNPSKASASSICRFQEIFRKGSFHFLRNSGKQLHSFPVQIQFKFLPFPFKGNSTATQGRGVSNAVLPSTLKKKTTQNWVLTLEMSNL